MGMDEERIREIARQEALLVMASILPPDVVNTVCGQLGELLRFINAGQAVESTPPLSTKH